MKLLNLKTAFLLLSLTCTTTAFAANSCFEHFYEVQKQYTTKNFEATVAVSERSGVSLFAMNHLNVNDTPYTTWQSLNGEIEGYALKELHGIDFNKDRQYVGPMLWHQSAIWDKLFYDKTVLKNYQCTLVGRTRVSGRKVTVAKLSPIDDARYSFVIASDNETNLPVELSVVSPSNALVVKLTVTAMHGAQSNNTPFPDEVFDSIKINSKDLSFAKVWPELFVPKTFALIDAGVQKMNDEEVQFQVFSDGITDFRVYKNSKTSVMIPSATDGTISVLRKSGKFKEYAVVGEIPLEMANIILSKINSND